MKKELLLYGLVLLLFMTVIPVAGEFFGRDIVIDSPYITENESGTAFTVSDGFALDHDLMIWETYRQERNGPKNVSGSIRMMNLTDGNTRILATFPSPGHKEMFDTPFGFSDGRVVWLEDFNVWVYDKNVEKAYPLTTDGVHVDLSIQRENRDPFISADRIVWAKKKLYPYVDYDIVLYNLASQTLTDISTAPGKKSTPVMDGTRIVWSDKRDEPDDGDIYLYDLVRGIEIPLCTARDLQQHPAISGNYVVWEDFRNGNPGIYLYNLTSMTENRISDTNPLFLAGMPLLSGNFAAWTEYSVSDKTREDSRRVIVYNILTGERELFLSGSTRPVLLDLDDNRILYADPENKSLEEGFAHLFMIDVPQKTAAPTEPSPDPAQQNITYPDNSIPLPAPTQTSPAGIVPLAAACGILVILGYGCRKR